MSQISCVTKGEMSMNDIVISGEFVTRLGYFCLGCIFIMALVAAFVVWMSKKQHDDNSEVS